MCGICAGVAIVLVPLFLSELSPDAIRGKISLMFAISITFGEVLALSFGVPLGYGINPYYWMIVFLLPLPIWIL
jgi:MFS family permease